MPIAPKYIPAYLTPADFAPISIEKPAIPRKETKMLQRPRWPVRSAINPTAIVNTAAAAYGGTERSWAWMDVYPKPKINTLKS